MSEPIVMLHHARPLYCAKGMRPWFSSHNLDWSDFIKNGIAGEALLQIGDHFALSVLEIARLEQQNGRL